MSLSRLDLDQLQPTNSLRKRRELQPFPIVISLSQSREIFPIAVNGIEQRYQKTGKALYPFAKSKVLTAE